MPNGGADEELITRFTVESDDAISNILALREEVNKTRQDLKALAETTKTSYRDAAKGILDAAKAARDAQIESIRQTGEFQGKLLTGPVQEEAVIAKLKEDYNSYKDVVTRALAEITQAQKQYDQAVKQSAKERVADQKQNVKLQTELEKQALQEQQSLEKEKLAIQKQTIKEREAETKQRVALEKEVTKQTLADQKQALKEQEAQIKQRVLLEKEAAKQASEAQREYVKVTQQGYGVMSVQAQEFGKQVEAVRNQIVTTSQQTGQSFGQVGQQLVKAGADINTVNIALKQLNTGTQQATSGLGRFLQNFSSLGSIVGFVSGILGIFTFSVLRGLIRNLQEAAKAGEDLVRSLVKLSVATRALQRRGLDVTFGESVKQAEALREQFGTFSRREAVEGIAQVQFLTRNFGFTNEQMQDAVEISAALATVLGQDMGEEARKLALFLSSGYAESLQRAGLAVNRLTVAQEAARLGFGDNYLALTEQERAYAGLSLVIKQSGDLIEDAAKIQESATGRIDKATASIETSTQSLGARLVFLNVALKEAGAIGVGAFARFIDFATRNFINLASAVGAATIALGAFIKGLIELVKGNFVSEIFNLGDVFAKAFRQFQEFGERQAFPELFDPFGEAGGVGAGIDADELEAELATVEDTYEKFRDNVLDIMTDYANKMRDLNIDLQRDLEKIERDGARRREEINRQFADRLAKIDRDAQRNIGKERRDLANDLAKIERDVQRRQEEARRNFRQKEIDDEEKFQLRLKKLREDFIFDIEEAVRARDAKQIRRLTRQFNKERGQLIDQRELEKKQRRRDLAEELEDIRRQGDERRAERQLQFAQRLEDIRLQQQIQRQEAELAHQQELEDLNRRLQEQRADRLRAYQDQIRDLQRSINDRLRTIAQGLAAEVKLTQQGIDAVYQRLFAYFGPGGYVQQLYDYYRQFLSQQDLSFPTPQLPTGSPAPGGFAHGGTFVATRPISRTFGEVPELVNIMPLSGLGRNIGKFFGDISGGDLSYRDGKLALELFLSPDLEARILEQSMENVNDVLVNVKRSRS